MDHKKNIAGKQAAYNTEFAKRQEKREGYGETQKRIAYARQQELDLQKSEQLTNAQLQMLQGLKEHV